MRHLLWGCPYLPSLEFEAAACPFAVASFVGLRRIH